MNSLSRLAFFKSRLRCSLLPPLNESSENDWGATHTSSLSASNEYTQSAKLGMHSQSQPFTSKANVNV